MKWHRNVVEALLPALHGIFASGQPAEPTVARLLKSQPRWGARDRRAVAESLYDAVRWWRWHWHLAGLPADDALVPAAITPERTELVWAVGCLERHGAVPSAVALDDGEVAERRLAAPASRAVRESVPDWIDEIAFSELGDEWPPLLTALNVAADVFVRVNPLRTTRDALVATLAREGIDATPVHGAPEALRLPGRRQVAALQPWKDGAFEVQDAGSQLVTPLLGAQPGETVVDLCAGGGGKTLHLAALMQNRGRIIAGDVHAWKLEELRRRATRAGVSLVETAVLTEDEAAFPVATADRVLLDVPCSGLGVLRRHPDTKWKLTPAELDRLRAVQAAILRRGSRLVRPGGTLLYVTCSVLRSENEAQVAAFLASDAGKGWRLESERRILPQLEGFDAFYATRLTR